MLRTNDDEQLKNLQNPERPDESTGIARPPRTSQKLFAGWGPALLTAAVTLFALLCASMPASAATKVIALSTCAADHGAVLLSHPDVILPDLFPERARRLCALSRGLRPDRQHRHRTVIGRCRARLRRDTCGTGFALRAGQLDCQASGDSVLYRVIFAP